MTCTRSMPSDKLCNVIRHCSANPSASGHERGCSGRPLHDRTHHPAGVPGRAWLRRVYTGLGRVKQTLCHSGTTHRMCIPASRRRFRQTRVISSMSLRYSASDSYTSSIICCPCGLYRASGPASVIGPPFQTPEAVLPRFKHQRRANDDVKPSPRPVAQCESVLRNRMSSPIRQAECLARPQRGQHRNGNTHHMDLTRQQTREPPPGEGRAPHMAARSSWT